MQVEVYSRWEIALAGVILLLALAELLSLVIARKRGLTHNISRLVSHFALSLLLLVYIALTWIWKESLALTGPSRSEAPTANWTYLLLAAVIGILVSREVLSHLRARRQGLTRNLSRLVTHLAMLILLLVMVGINLAKWDAYLQRLEETYQESLTAAGPAPTRSRASG